MSLKVYSRIKPYIYIYIFVYNGAWSIPSLRGFGLLGAYRILNTLSRGRPLPGAPKWILQDDEQGEHHPSIQYVYTAILE